MKRRIYKIYLAGPDVFLPDARHVGQLKQQLCKAFDFEGLFPLDTDDKIAGDAASIFRANCSLMRQADVGLCNLTPFRGPSADPGTVFELGFLFTLGKPVYGYTSAVAGYRERVLATVERGAPPRDRHGYAVENFGLSDNLMIVRAIEESGGVISAIEEQEDDSGRPSLVALRAFKACLEIMHERVRAAAGDDTRQSHGVG